jgi:hypothetical protein
MLKGLEDMRRCTAEIDTWLCSGKPEQSMRASAHGNSAPSQALTNVRWSRATSTMPQYPDIYHG